MSFTLFNEKFEPIKNRVITISTPIFHFYANQVFGVRIINKGDYRIYSNNETYYDSVSNNFAYSLYIPKNGQTVDLEVIPLDNFSPIVIYRITYDDGNILDDSQQFYYDELVNKKLPSLDELISAKVPSDNFSDRDLLKRLLLDSVMMMQNKGSKDNIENLFKFLGYEDYSDTKLEVFDMYKTSKTDPTKKIKTGIYYLIYQYFDTLQPELDRYNMPNIEISITSFDKFMANVLNLIKIANIYFTTDEQIIDNINLVLMANAPKFIGTLNRNYIHSFYDVAYLRHNVDISSWGYDVTELPDDELIPTNYIQNTFSEENILPKIKEIRFLTNPDNFNNFVFQEIDEEVTLTSEVVEEDLEKMDRGFGSIIHLKIDIKDSKYLFRNFVEIELYDVDDNLVKYVYPKTEFTLPVLKSFALYKYATYKLNIRIYDPFGAYETYEYYYVLNEMGVILKTDSWDSVILDKNKKALTTETTEPNLSLVPVTIGTYKNMILPQYLVPALLADYQSVAPDNKTLWMEGDFSSKALFKRFNNNHKLKDVTSADLCLIDTFIDIVSIPYEEGDELVFKVYDPTTSFKYIPYTDLGDYPIMNNFFIQLVDVTDQEDVTTKNWMIFTTVTGFEVPEDLIHIKRGTEYIQITEDYITPFPVFFDIPLILNPNAYEGYISPTIYTTPVTIDDVTVNVPCVKSIFTCLTPLNVSNYENKLNDILIVRLSEDYIYYPFQVRWTVLDSFTQEILYESSDKTLKYRCNVKGIIDVKGEFYLNTINGLTKFEVYNQSIINVCN